MSGIVEGTRQLKGMAGHCSSSWAFPADNRCGRSRQTGRARRENVPKESHQDTMNQEWMFP
jgi:hypothetical protein